MKKYTFVFLMLLATGLMHAQEIDVKKNIVSIDGKECLKVDKKDLNNVSISDLNGNDLVYLKYADDKFGKRYNTIIFVNSKKSLYTQQFIYVNAKMLIKRLIENHVLEDCKINDAKAENFVVKYNENVQLN
jgi:hypothetical protein